MIYKEIIKQEQMELCQFLNKPKQICKDITDRDRYLLSLSKEDFIREYKKQINQEIEDFGFLLRKITLDDIDTVYSFIIQRFDDKYIEDISHFDIFRFIEYGHGLVIEDSGNNIIACLFEIGYEKNCKISYSIRLGVDEKQKGKGLGRLITTYSSLLAMENGATIKRGLMDYDNFISQHIHINQLGWIFDEFYPNIKSLGFSFSSSMLLTPHALLTNRIDTIKLQNFIQKNIEGSDYYRIKYNDFETITRIYSETDFRIIAVIKNQDSKFDFIALPTSIIYSQN